MEYITLSNGVKMPTLGYGVFLVSPDECERCVSDALSVGYRLILIRHRPTRTRKPLALPGARVASNAKIYSS